MRRKQDVRRPKRPVRRRLPELQDGARFAWGAASIAAVIGRTTKSTYNLLEGGHLSSARKISGVWVAAIDKLVREVSGEATS